MVDLIVYVSYVCGGVFHFFMWCLCWQTLTTKKLRREIALPKLNTRLAKVRPSHRGTPHAKT
jgi:hypothetical protein